MYTPLSDQHKLHAMKLNNARDFFSSFITGTTQRQKCDTFTVTVVNDHQFASEQSRENWSIALINNRLVFELQNTILWSVGTNHGGTLKKNN